MWASMRRSNLRVELVMDRPDREIAFQLLEGLLDLGELPVKAPQAGRVVVAEVGAQQVAAFAPPGLASLFLAPAIGGDR